MLSFPALGLLFFYSYTKRFTVLAHLVLGFCLGLAAPAGTPPEITRKLLDAVQTAARQDGTHLQTQLRSCCIVLRHTKWMH